MKNTNHVINALPLVADALGKKFGIKVHIGGDRAYTNGRDIHLPALPLDSDEAVLNVARGFLDHEAAHLRITDFDAVKAANLSTLERHVWNTLEDFMVERKLGEMYPGCIRNFQWLIKRMFLEDDGKEGQPINTVMDIFNWLLLSVRCLVVPELSARVDTLAKRIDKNYPKLLSSLIPLVQEIPSVCLNTGACISQARKIVQVIQKYADAHEDAYANKADGNKQEKNIGGNDRERDSASQTQNNNNNERDFDSSPQSSTAGDGETAPTPQISTNAEITGNEPVKDTDSNANLPVSKDSTPHSLKELLQAPQGMESMDFGEKLENLLQGFAGQSKNNLTVAIIGENKCSAFTPDEISNIRRSTTGLRARLQGLLQANSPIRNRISRTGRIDPKLVGRLAVNDPKIFMRKGERQGINTLVHILLDASYSMERGKITLACQACYAVSSALEPVHGVSVAVTAFPAGMVFPPTCEDLLEETVWPVLTPKQRLHPNFNFEANGGTPLAEALWWVMQQMQGGAENRKIILILSDGMPDNMETARNIIGLHQKHGHEVYGIGIMTCEMENLLPKRYCRGLYDLEALAPVMFELLRKSMIKSGGGANEDAA